MAKSRRQELHKILLKITPSVHFQPPEDKALTYPCIIYRRSNTDIDRADNLQYSIFTLYDITVIDRDPDSELYIKILELPLSSHDRSYQSKGLNHDVLQLYY